jgi:hypothetical protein
LNVTSCGKAAVVAPMTAKPTMEAARIVRNIGSSPLGLK